MSVSKSSTWFAKMRRIMEDEDIRREADRISWCVFGFELVFVLVAIVVTLIIAFTINDRNTLESFVFNMAWVASLAIYLVPVTWYYEPPDPQDRLLLSSFITTKDRVRTRYVGQSVDPSLVLTQSSCAVHAHADGHHLGDGNLDGAGEIRRGLC